MNDSRNTTRTFLTVGALVPWTIRVVASLLLVCSSAAVARNPAPHFPSPRGDKLTTADMTGWLRTVTPTGHIDEGNPFFKSLGSNGRSCSSCHRQAEGWTISAAEVRQRFRQTDGKDPIFRLVDGATSPLDDVSTLAAREQAYSMLLKHGDLRIGIGIPANAEFTLTEVDDPYGYASAKQLSLFRRPLPATNLVWLTGVMWDGRETAAPFHAPMDAGEQRVDIDASLALQASDAILGHEQASAPADEKTIAQIVDFESHLNTAQVRDRLAGFLYDDDAIGGPRMLVQQRFWIGINDPLGNDPTGEAFDPRAMRLFDGWRDADNRYGFGLRGFARASIVRGEKLFNSMPIAITGVAGLNDATGKPLIHGHCSTCHNAPGIGNHSVGSPLNIGISDASRRTSDMPLYTLTNKKTGAVVQTTDPGLALITGKWKDIGKFKGPILRGVVSHPPYFHNGSAATLVDAVNFYDTRFHIGMTERQKEDLVAFLSAL
jgi:cytochrome c peroxidase